MTTNGVLGNQYDGFPLTYHWRVLPDGTRGDMTHEVFLHEWIAGHQSADVPAEIAAILDRNARAAVVMDEFHHRLLTESKRTPFPATEFDPPRAAGSAPH